MRSVALGVLLASGIAAASGSVATAADLPVKAPYVQPPIVSWTGFYIGGHVGAGWGTLEGETVGGAFVFGQGTVNGFIGGGQVGFNWQTGPIVVGIEADASASSLKGTAPCIIGFFVCKGNVDWTGTVAGRLGFTADKALIYVKGGAGWAEFKYNVSVLGLGIATADQGRWGGLVGVGVEYAFLPGWSAKLEYNYIDVGQHTTPFALAIGGGAINVNTTENLHLVKFGVNYRIFPGGWAM